MNKISQARIKEVQHLAATDYKYEGRDAIEFALDQVAGDHNLNRFKLEDAVINAYIDEGR